MIIGFTFFYRQLATNLLEIVRWRDTTTSLINDKLASTTISFLNPEIPESLLDEVEEKLRLSLPGDAWFSSDVSYFVFYGRDLAHPPLDGLHRTINLSNDYASQYSRRSNDWLAVSYQCYAKPEGFREPELRVWAHVQDIGDVVGSDGEFVGASITVGGGEGPKRLEAIGMEIISLDHEINPFDEDLIIAYKVRMEGLEDSIWTSKRWAGTVGQSRPITGYAVQILGPASRGYSVRYRARYPQTDPSRKHERPVTGYCYDGEMCEAGGAPLEAIEVTVVSPEDRDLIL